MTTTHLEKRPGRPAAQDTTDVRRKLLDATRAACISKGLDGVSSKEIAAEAGVNPAMINYYFGNRETLHEAMMLDALSPLLAQFSLAEENSHKLKLRQFLRAYMETLAANPWLPRLVVREVLPVGCGKKHHIVNTGKSVRETMIRTNGDILDQRDTVRSVI